jgi:transposase-like protein
MRTRNPLTAELTGKRWNEGTARRALAAWRRSGMSGSAFARANGMNPQRLFWWRKQLDVGETAAAPLTFIPATPAAVVGARVLLRLPGGVEVEATEAEAMPATWVSALVRELSRPA